MAISWLCSVSFFDMVKPWPIGWLDKRVHGGLGIMIDDIVAGIMAAISLYAVAHFQVGLFKNQYPENEQ